MSKVEEDPRTTRSALDARVPPTYDLRTLGGGLEPYHAFDALIADFLKSAERHLGPALANIPKFLEGIRGETGRDDERYRQTTRERYAVELLACSVMARQFWPAFVERRQTVLILPDCLRIQEEGCARRETRAGSACTMCHRHCLVGRMTETGRRFGAPAFFSDIDHTRQFKALKKLYPELSVVGVACVLMLADGMRAAEAAGIPSQGVLLTYCGCDHWTDDTFTTHTAVERLESILAAKAARTEAAP